MASRYKKIDPDQVLKTLEQLEMRIGERFPGAGLRGVCRELIEAARESKLRIAQIEAPNMALRIVSVAAMACGALLLAYIGSIIEVKRDAENLYGVLQGFDSAFNIVVLMGAGALFLSSLESRSKRQRALSHLHELRSIIHIVDMHQLTKDPSRVTAISVPTVHSPARALTPFELSRYLDYCSEMLSLSAKVAALYAQGTKDPIVIEAASDLEQITSNMSGKIWQKITMVQNQMAIDQSAAHTPNPLLPPRKP